MQRVFPAVVLTSQGRRWSIFSPVDTFSLLFEANQPTKAPTLGRSEASKTLSKIFYFRFFLKFFCFDLKTLTVSLFLLLHCLRFFLSLVSKLDSSLLFFFGSKICSGSFLKCAYFRFQSGLKNSHPAAATKPALIQFRFILSDSDRKARPRHRSRRHGNSVSCWCLAPNFVGNCDALERGLMLIQWSLNDDDSRRKWLSRPTYNAM